jgi:Trypsin
MKKLILIYLLMCHASLAFALGGKASSLAGSDLEAKSVMVLGSRGSACSGVIVAPNIVLTAGHCVQGSPQLAVAYYEGQTPVLKTVVQSAVNPSGVDMALVRVIGLPARFTLVELVENNELATRYSVAGFGLQAVRVEDSAGKLRKAEVESLPLSATRILHLGGANMNKDEMSTHLQVCKGDSGGPVFTTDMKLAGVIFATYNTGVKQGDKWSAQCGNTAQAVRIEPQRAWIDSVLGGWK